MASNEEEGTQGGGRGGVSGSSSTYTGRSRGVRLQWQWHGREYMSEGCRGAGRWGRDLGEQGDGAGI